MSDNRQALPPALRESRDVGVKSVFALLVLIASTLLLMLGLAYWLFPGEAQDQRFAQPFPKFPSPELQHDPPTEMAAFYAREMAALDSAGWQDKAAGTVHIPIGQAMRAVAAEGIAGWPNGAAR